MSVEARFLEDSNGCWIFQGGRTQRGYGRWSVTDESTGRRVYAAHRSMWTIHFGTIPVGLQVLHKCDVKPCINPDHLYLGTAADNTRDALERGQILAGHRYRRSLSDKQVREIRSSSLGESRLCRKYGAAKGTIWKIRKRLTYTDVSDA